MGCTKMLYYGYDSCYEGPRDVALSAQNALQFKLSSPQKEGTATF